MPVGSISEEKNTELTTPGRIRHPPNPRPRHALPQIKIPIGPAPIDRLVRVHSRQGTYLDTRCRGDLRDVDNVRAVRVEFYETKGGPWWWECGPCDAG
jgi:hypothetical protein